MAKTNVIIFDGEDKFISKKKHVYNKNKGKSKYVGADGSGQQPGEGAISVGTPMPEVSTSSTTQETAAPPQTQPSTPISSSYQSTPTKNCPAGFRDYNGTCVPITNTQGACQQGYMKEYVGGPCVPIPASGAIGGCAAGYEYKMGFRLGDLTATMGCYPIGSYQDIGKGSSTGGILSGESGTNIGGGGNVQGGGGNYASGGGTSSGGSSTITCNDSQIFDPITGSCIPKYTTAPVPCPAGYVRDEKTNTCIESVNPKDYKCPQVDLPTPPKCKKYAVVGKDQFGCDRYDLVDDAENCPSVIKEEPINCQDGLIYSVELKKCVNPIDETKKPPISTPEGTCPEGYEFNIEQQKCISKCGEGMTYDVVNKICVTPKQDEPKKNPYCSQNMVWDETQQKCVFTGTVEPAPVTKATTSTTTTTTTIGGGGNVIIPGLGIAPGGTGTGGGGGGGSEDGTQPIVAPKNYFWYYVAAGAIGFYLFRKITK
jgi:hypothetical protein